MIHWKDRHSGFFSKNDQPYKVQNFHPAPLKDRKVSCFWLQESVLELNNIHLKRIFLSPITSADNNFLNSSFSEICQFLELEAFQKQSKK